MRQTPTPGCRHSTNIRLALGTFRRWLRPIADFFSAKNESEAEARGVEKVALPARGRLSRKRAERQKQRWFKRALRWRAGWEATISTLKHPFSMWRATYKGEHGFQRYVGWSVITKNLFSIARWLERKKREARCPSWLNPPRSGASC